MEMNFIERGYDNLNIFLEKQLHMLENTIKGDESIYFNITHNKDIEQIEKLYKIVVKNCKILADTLEFTHPAEIYAMYRYLLLEGYLSKNKGISYAKKDFIDIPNILGANIFSGQAVCRHIETMLRDIYKEIGFESQILTVRTKAPFLMLSANKDNKSFYELHELVRNNMRRGKNRDNIERKIDEAKGTIMVSKQAPHYEDNYFKSNEGNHVITLVVKNGICTIYDATNNIIYNTTVLIKEKPNYLIAEDGYIVKICPKEMWHFNSKKEIKDAEINLSLPKSSYIEDFYLAQEAREICKDNIDLLEYFYQNNYDLYNEADEKIKLISNRKNRLK